MRYADAVEAAAQAAGMSSSARKLQAVHFEWTARYQVGEESVDDILADAADSTYEQDKRKVRKAIQRTLDLLGFQSRGQRGRYPRHQSK
jgi:hypothetical protein